MNPHDAGLPPLGGPLLFHDLAELRRLRADGRLVGLRPLEALVAIRRARRYGAGSPRLRAETPAPSPGTCPDCRGMAWSSDATGGRRCGNCGHVEERRSS
jgi:hypothetical protein